MPSPSVPNVSDTRSNSGAFTVGLNEAQQANGGNTDSEAFVDRRGSNAPTAGTERRQFGSSHDGLSEAGRELALAMDRYKLENHRRYITCDEMLVVLTELGYGKVKNP